MRRSGPTGVFSSVSRAALPSLRARAERRPDQGFCVSNVAVIYGATWSVQLLYHTEEPELTTGSRARYTRIRPLFKS